jgi:hypothetical protein
MENIPSEQQGNIVTIINKKIVLVITVLVILGIAVLLFIYKGTYLLKDSQITEGVNATSSQAFEPVKQSFTQKLPDGFPTGIPLPQGVNLSQSYSLDYSNASSSKKQFTVVFGSKKTIEENYNTYSAFLKKDEWNIISENASTSISSLYATKADFAAQSKQDINITISNESDLSTTTVSLVSITILNK